MFAAMKVGDKILSLSPDVSFGNLDTQKHAGKALKDTNKMHFLQEGSVIFFKSVCLFLSCRF